VAIELGRLKESEGCGFTVRLKPYGGHRTERRFEVSVISPRREHRNRPGWTSHRLGLITPP
jgi:hypothetical protein